MASLRINLARLAMGLGSSNVLVESIIERLQRFRSRLPGNLYFPIFGNRNMKCDENFSFFFFLTYPLPRVLSTLAGLPSVLILLWGARVACSRCRSRNISLAGY